MRQICASRSVEIGFGCACEVFRMDTGEAAAMVTHKGLKVLLIDDDPGILKVMTIALEDEGYTVISANDGESGMDLCASDSPDVVVTDIRMPGIDGMEVLRRIKEMVSGQGSHRGDGLQRYQLRHPCSAA